ncbi:SusE domain-containing protein [Dysgonomonas sp. ZJ279]|uniref:SusE domain-containing protein n=1 Tax=Dysgonomonas sp. ZJ279 TaxID=2709796 RepID=UPI0013ED25D3|nr:SusE domain-containing protein [Dysgonomonas sp. ZJ279]
MKTYKIFLASLFCILALCACNKDETPVLTHVETSILDNLPAQNYILEEPAKGTNPLLFTVTWTETVFHFDGENTPRPAGPVNYTLQIDRKGNNFASAQVLAATNTLSSNIYLNDINLLLLNKLGALPNEAIDVELRIVADYGQNMAGLAISGNTLPVSITPYEAKKELQALYIIGDMNSWNNTNTDFIMYRNNNSDEEIYTYTGRLAANTYFKFILEQDLGTNKMYSRNDETTLVYAEMSDGAFHNETEGYKTITLNLKELTYTIVDYDASADMIYNTIGPIGGFCDWDNEPAMIKSAYDPHQWSITYEFKISTACKFRGNKDWVYNWGGDSSDIPYGKAVFDGAGTDIKTPGTYKINYNDITHHFVILSQE